MWIVLLKVAGCSLFANVTGNWEGECVQEGDRLDVELDIEEDLSGQIEGDMTFSDPSSSYSIKGEFEGERSDEEIEGEAKFIGSSGWTQVEFEAEIDGDELEAVISVQEGDYTASLDCELDRE
ncbi:MAG: hypothetical protein FJ102_18450 [Deltaproteobacteria bacterium]|nr:hypothetical protein [Deltaproteobacteria bacterium]